MLSDNAGLRRSPFQTNLSMLSRPFALTLAVALLVMHEVRAAESVLEMTARPDQVQVIDQAIGQGLAVRGGAWAVVQYTGWVFDPGAPEGKGTKFASSRDRGESLSFLYGFKRVVPGLEKGMEGMRVGGKRTILVPPKFGFDGLKYPRPSDVPPRSTLVFEVELTDVVPQSAPPEE